MTTAAWVITAIVAALTGHAVVNARLLRRPGPERSTTTEGVSVLLPVRDEAHRVVPCLEALLAQRGVPHLEIIVLDDGSTDGTAEVVGQLAAGDPRVRVVTGRPLPAGWLGKPHACHQLAASAAADHSVLAFVDADVVLAPDAVATSVALLGTLDLLTPYPRIIAVGWGERLVQPLLQWSWLTFLPLRGVERSRRPSLAAAGGQFLVVRRAGYERAGGHAAVRDRVLEDIELARRIKRTGGRIALADGSRLASCRMYTSWNELVAGYTKSLWASFGSPAAALGVVTALLILYVGPVVVGVAGLFAGSPSWIVAGLVGYGLGVLGRVVTARATGARVFPDALAQPASIVLFGWLVVTSLRRRRALSWKGRPVEVRHD